MMVGSSLVGAGITDYFCLLLEENVPSFRTRYSVNHYDCWFWWLSWLSLHTAVLVLIIAPQLLQVLSVLENSLRVHVFIRCYVLVPILQQQGQVLGVEQNFSACHLSGEDSIEQGVEHLAVFVGTRDKFYQACSTILFLVLLVLKIAILQKVVTQWQENLPLYPQPPQDVNEVRVLERDEDPEPRLGTRRLLQRNDGGAVEAADRHRVAGPCGRRKVGRQQHRRGKDERPEGRVHGEAQEPQHSEGVQPDAPQQFPVFWLQRPAHAVARWLGSRREGRVESDH